MPQIHAKVSYISVHFVFISCLDVTYFTKKNLSKRCIVHNIYCCDRKKNARNHRDELGVHFGRRHCDLTKKFEKVIEIVKRCSLKKNIWSFDRK